MATKRAGQRWVLDALVGQAGWDVLHPEARGIFYELGYFHSDINRVFSKVGSTLHFSRAWLTTGQEVEKKARWAEERGHRLAARDFYQRAALLYGRGQYGFFGDDPRKSHFHDKMLQCFQKVIEYTPGVHIERVILPFEGKDIYGVLYVPEGEGPFPCVLMGPGMDMIKEDWHVGYMKYFLPRGFAALAIDGPGQGETLLHGCKVTLDNYERAASVFLDFLTERREIDSDRLVHYGVSMGSYWGCRLAAHDGRIKASATAMGCTSTMEVIFHHAQPNFKANFMYMAGYQDEDAFDREIMQHMNLDGIVENVKCPLLMMHGEFDELTPLEAALATYERAAKPKAMWVFGEEFHPLGGAGVDILTLGADWLVAMMDGKYDPNMDDRLYFGRDGTIIKGDSRPPWWDGVLTPGRVDQRDGAAATPASSRT
ncbi:MAG: alpha/beta hydrolase [Dehalococcoidia bacterium]|nr:alpha/beta hydrolase [Dehalococcoidia bacterium]